MNTEIEDRPLLALLLGDATGIGPEIVARALYDGRIQALARLVVVGDARVFELGMKDAGVALNYVRIGKPREFAAAKGAIPLIDLGNIDPDAFARGQMSAESGRLTGDTLQVAIGMAERGEVEGVTFAPLNKQALNAGGWRYPDEHKMFAALLRHNGHFSEMNVLDDHWMSRVTSHVSLRTALDQVTHQNIVDAIRLTDRTLRSAGVETPRIAVAALNPHGGEGGLFGSEEIEIIKPAVEAAAATGIDCSGPYPADTIYLKAFEGRYDSVVAMYHDQGQIATKLRGFNRGVTITAGLATVFTTPAHGTAFDIVGQGRANTGALERAVELAVKIARGRRAERVPVATAAE